MLTFALLIVLYLVNPSNINITQECVLLTGGLGFIGSNLVDELLLQGYKVVVFDDKSTGHHYNNNAITIIGDISVNGSLDSITHEVHYIVHFAAAISVTESMKDPAKYERINVLGSHNVLEWAVKRKVKKVISASSAAVYGAPKELPLSETSAVAPISPYAETKLNMEILQKKLFERHGTTCICLRFFNVYGPRQSPKSSYSGVISKFIEQAVEGKEIVIYGDGLNTRDFVFVKDVAAANIMAIKHGEGFRVYNVGTEHSITILQLAETIIQVTNSTAKIVLKDERSGDIKHSLSNTTRIRTDLSWYPKVRLNEGLQKTFAWYVESATESGTKCLVNCTTSG